MTCPAEITFKRDRTLTPSAIRLYHFLSTVLDFSEPRERKVYADAEAAGISEKSALAGLHQLLARGYLICHGRSAKGVYSLTLANSIGSDLPARIPASTTSRKVGRTAGAYHALLRHMAEMAAQGLPVVAMATDERTLAALLSSADCASSDALIAKLNAAGCPLRSIECLSATTARS
ncbi:MAG: hypothetical protein Q8K55_06445 [Gemmatimonadaceae bacterium]|nr:hypothetical protein [Gemmatimonadaceae bacterium]